jgi:hypothetical protein
MKQNHREIVFQEHNKSMKQFCASHIKLTLVNAPRYAEPAVLARTQLLRLSPALSDNGGSAGTNRTMDWAAFAWISKVKSYKLLPN